MKTLYVYMMLAVFCITDNSSDTITFRSKSGPLIARRNGDGITLDFPINPVQPYDKTAVLPIIKVSFLLIYFRLN